MEASVKDDGATGEPRITPGNAGSSPATPDDHWPLPPGTLLPGALCLKTLPDKDGGVSFDCLCRRHVTVLACADGTVNVAIGRKAEQ